MSGPKSDRATIAARRDRLSELLSEGKTMTEAGEILRDEGFPASHDRIEADIEALLPAWHKETLDSFSVHWSNQYIDLQQLKAMAHDGRIKPDRMVELLLGILDREMRLTGTAAPTQTESKNTNVEVSVEPNLYTWCFTLFNKVTDKAGLKAECERIAATFREDVKPIEVPAHILSDGGGKNVS